MAPATIQPANYSLFSIPAYLIIALAPHFYSTVLLTPTTKPKSDDKAKSKPPPTVLYNMANPRSTNNNATYASYISPATYAKWERARAAHNNMLENAAFFVSAILAGIVTKCEAQYMNTVAGLYLATRVAYLFSYINFGHGIFMLLRTVWYFLGMVLLFSVWWEAGKKVMVGGF